MDKLHAIKIKQEDGTYSDEIPISVIVQNVDYNNSYTLKDILGNVHTSNPIQNQIDALDDAIKVAAVQNIAPVYDATKTYAEGDVVSYEGKVYKCTTAVDTAEAFDPEKWTKTDVVGMVSGGSSLKNIKDAEYGGIVGGLVDIETAEDYAGESLPADFELNLASGWFSHAEGGGVDWEYDENENPYVISRRTQATAMASHAEGFGTEASADSSHAEGDRTVASGGSSHAEGFNTVASGFHSHAEGYSTVASGQDSHAEGYRTVAEGDYSHAEGDGAVSHGRGSHAEGLGTNANCRSQHVFGEYNVVDTSTNFAYNRGAFVEIVGNGTSSTGRSNARTLDWSGNEALSGNLTLGKGTANETELTAEKLKELVTSDVRDFIVHATENEEGYNVEESIDDVTSAYLGGKSIYCRVTSSNGKYVDILPLSYVSRYFIEESGDYGYEYWFSGIVGNNADGYRYRDNSFMRLNAIYGVKATSIAPLWSDGAYTVGDYVMADPYDINVFALYKCTTDTSGSFDPESWDEVTVYEMVRDMINQ